MIGRNKSVGPDGIPDAILKMGGEAMIPYLARLLDITINNGTIPRDWKKSHSSSYSQRRRSFGSQKLQAGQFNLSSIQTNGTRHSIRQVWEDSNWLYEGQHGFRQGYSCESQIITVCQDIWDFLDEAARLDAIIIDFSKTIDLVPHDRLLKKLHPRAWIQGWSYGLGNF